MNSSACHIAADHVVGPGHSRVLRRRVLASLFALTIIAVMNASAQTPSSPRQLLDRAVASFEAGRIADSVSTFEQLARLAPDEAPYLWQRGIALYYAGRFAECRAQFESHRLVNPADVENAAWHFLCVARAESPEKARAALLPVGEDRRPPMAQIYQMFRGDATPEAVLRAAGSSVSGLFYAHLYIGLYAEARGDARQAREHITEAAKPEYAAAGGYMHRVARVHLQQLTRR